MQLILDASSINQWQLNESHMAHHRPLRPRREFRAEWQVPHVCARRSVAIQPIRVRIAGSRTSGEGTYCKYCAILPECPWCHVRKSSSHFSEEKLGVCQGCVNKDKHNKRTRALLGSITEYALDVADGDADVRLYFNNHQAEIQQLIADHRRVTR